MAPSLHVDLAEKVIPQRGPQDPPTWASAVPKPLQDPRTIADRAIEVYKTYHEFNASLSWQVANGYTAIALADIRSDRKEHVSWLAKQIKDGEGGRPGLVNEFNDDTLWVTLWALCCLHVYTLTQDTWFLVRARKIWKHMHSTRSVCGKIKQCCGFDMEGGCYWTTRPDEKQINSITTGLYAELSVRLALLSTDESDQNERKTGLVAKAKSMVDRHTSSQATYEEYIEAARSSLGWVLRTRYRARDGVVLDHFVIDQDRAVDWTFTYTTAVTLGVCALLFQATNEKEYLTLACHMANQAMRNSSWVEENGVLTEREAYGHGRHDPTKNDDAVGFKSVLLRHLAVLFGVIRQDESSEPNMLETAQTIKKFIRINLESQLARNTDGKGRYGPWWNGPFEAPSSHSQMAVLDVMAAGVLVDAG